MNYLIKKATSSDMPLIRDLAYRIWPDTYGSILPKDQLDYMLDKMYNEKTLTEQLEQGRDFVLVYNGGDAVGFASTSLLIAPSVFKLHKLYVLPSEQGKGTGRFLIDTIIKDIKEKGATALRLNVNRHNKAKSFYEKLGFTVIKEENIDIGNGYFMDDYIMERGI